MAGGASVTPPASWKKDYAYRFLETEDEYFDYAPAPTPPQGRCCIYGLGLPEDILRKIYYENAERLLGIELKV
jgi:hypothetical protein